MTRDVIPIEIEATIDAAMQTNAQMVPKAQARTASATAAPSLPDQTQIPQWSFRRGSTRRGAGKMAILRRRPWRGFCSLCLGSVVSGWHIASPLLPHCFPLAGPIASHIVSPIGFLCNFFFPFTRFLTTPIMTRSLEGIRELTIPTSWPEIDSTYIIQHL